MRPIVGIISNHYLINDQYPAHANGSMNTDAVSKVAGAMPLTFPGDPSVVGIDELLETFDGFLLTGGRPNVHPVLGICRGFQEIAVAFGSTLHPEIRDLPGRTNHRMPPDGTLEEKFALRHDVHFTPGGPFARLMRSETVLTNTLHGQGIKQPGPRVRIDGWAPDETPEAIFIDGAPGFALAVQWHPEWNADDDPVSRPLFEAFGDACRAWRAERSTPLQRAG